MMHIRALTNQSLHVLPAEDFIAIDGVNEGDPLSFADDLVLDDVYRLTKDDARGVIQVGLGPRLKTLRVMEGSALGTSGNALYLDCCITMMDQFGTTFEALVLVETEDGMVADTFLLPLSELSVDARYRLVGIDRHAATRRFAEVACVSFAAGTRITLATGEQRNIEDLRVNDMVMTRDGGAQPLRWVGHATVRATGDFAPVRIAAGTLNNHRDLVISADHRVLVYQRTDHIGSGQGETMVKVRHLINGDTVVQESGGFVDYYQLLFDEHQIIYAEGLASESLLIDPRTRVAVPDEIAAQVLVNSDSQRSVAPQDYEVAASLLSQPDTVALLKQASTA